MKLMAKYDTMPAESSKPEAKPPMKAAEWMREFQGNAMRLVSLQ